MTIRTRLLVWYAVFLLALAFVVGVPSYQRLADSAGVVARIVLPAVIVVLVGGWWLTRRALAPIRALTAALERTNERHLGERLPRTGSGDELDRLTEVFNAMSARLDDSFRRIREFTLHASHELKTPLTVLRGEIEAASLDDTLTAPQRDRLLSQLDEIHRLAAIVDSLSLLTRADAGLVPLACEPVRFDGLVREMVEDLQHLAQGTDIRVVAGECATVTVAGDRHRLRQLLLTLADNAVKYNELGGSVHVSLRRVGDAAEAVIANTGPGLARACAGRVFERFYRGDASHSSSVEGCGLGLSIAKWIAEAHGGSIRFDSDTGSMTIVTVVLPAVPD